MAKRRKIALTYNYNENWIGGTYYIQNLIKALNMIDQDRQPEVVILSTEAQYRDLLKSVRYPFLTYYKYIRSNIFFRLINKISRTFIGRNLIDKYKSSPFKDVDCVFPVGGNEKNLRINHEINWIPDFQEHYYPNFFTDEEVKCRKYDQRKLSEKANPVVFSSESALRDFSMFYPENIVTAFVLPFAVTNELKTPDLPLTFNQQLPTKYFICSNQFWKHKNHSIIFHALNELKKGGLLISVIFTGKENDYRNPNYFLELKQEALDLKVLDNIFFLGFIERQEQLFLMKNAIGVIQPSFFEGWSTVVEDAKSLNVKVLASNIPVHCEQLLDYPSAFLFNPNSPKELAICLQKALEAPKPQFYDYDKRIRTYGNRFIDMIEQVCH